MSSTVTPKPETAVSLRGGPEHRAAQLRAAVAKGTPKGMPVQPSFRGMPSTFVYGDDGYARVNGSIAAGRGSAAVGSSEKPYKWLPSVTPLSPNTAMAQVLGGQVGAGIRNYMGGKHEQARYAMDPSQGVRNAVAAGTAEDLTDKQRAAGAAAGGLQAAQQGAMWAPIIQAAAQSLKARSPLPLVRAAAGTYGRMAYGDTPVELMQRYAGANPDSASSQRGQNLLTSRLMAALSSGAASKFLKIAPIVNAGSEIVRGAQRGTTGEATPDYTALQSLKPGDQQVLDERATTGLERRQLSNVIHDVDQPVLKRLTALATAGVHGISSPLSISDGWSEADRGQSAITNLLEAPVPNPGTRAAEIAKSFQDSEMDVMYRNLFSGKQRDFTWPGEDKPGTWTREDMPDRYANDPKRWGTTDRNYEQSFLAQTRPVTGAFRRFLMRQEVPERLRPSSFRTPERAALYSKLYPKEPELTLLDYLKGGRH